MFYLFSQILDVATTKRLFRPSSLTSFFSIISTTLLPSQLKADTVVTVKVPPSNAIQTLIVPEAEQFQFRLVREEWSVADETQSSQSGLIAGNKVSNASLNANSSSASTPAPATDNTNSSSNNNKPKEIMPQSAGRWGGRQGEHVKHFLSSRKKY